MFTGIIRELGRVAELNGAGDGLRLTLEAPATAALTADGDSVALDGVCLTAVQVAGGRISFEALPETLQRTTLPRLTEGDHVNVEPALRAGDPLGGHYVQGHVDAIGRVRAVDE